jgi:hypothetical protein
LDAVAVERFVEQIFVRLLRGLVSGDRASPPLIVKHAAVGEELPQVRRDVPTRERDLRQECGSIVIAAVSGLQVGIVQRQDGCSAARWPRRQSACAASFSHRAPLRPRLKKS